MMPRVNVNTHLILEIALLVRGVVHAVSCSTRVSLVGDRYVQSVLSTYAWITCQMPNSHDLTYIIS